MSTVPRSVGGCRPKPGHATTLLPTPPPTPRPPGSPQQASSEHCLEPSILTSFLVVSLSCQLRYHHSVLSPLEFPPGIPVHLLALCLLPALCRRELLEPCAGPSLCLASPLAVALTCSGWGGRCGLDLIQPE